MNKNNLIILSGGQDSATIAELALKRGVANVTHFVTFIYGQRHREEVGFAERHVEDLRARYGDAVGEHHKVDISCALTQSVSALIGTAGDTTVNNPHPAHAELPASFVPNRNLLFLTIAHQLAQKLECEAIYTGVNAEDYSGYPDCRPEFVEAAEIALNLGVYGDDTGIAIVAPLIEMSKVEIWRLADELDVLPRIINNTLTCYNGVTTKKHSWGYGCGQCPACRIRAKSYALAFPPPQPRAGEQLELPLD